MEFGSSVRLPVTTEDWIRMVTTIRYVIGKGTYFALAVLAGFLCLSAIAIGQNVELFVRVVVFGQLPVLNRVAVLVAMYPFLGVSFEPPMASVTVVLSLLIGLDIALLTYHFRVHGLSLGSGAGGTIGWVGAIFGALGAGCVVCGVSLVSGLLSLLGLAGIALFLPFDGVGFAVLGGGMVILSMFWITEGMYGGIQKEKLGS